MAATIRLENGTAQVTPWLIDYARSTIPSATGSSRPARDRAQGRLGRVHLRHRARRLVSEADGRSCLRCQLCACTSVLASTWAWLRLSEMNTMLMIWVASVSPRTSAVLTGPRSRSTSSGSARRDRTRSFAGGSRGARVRSSRRTGHEAHDGDRPMKPRGCARNAAIAPIMNIGMTISGPNSRPDATKIPLSPAAARATRAVTGNLALPHVPDDEPPAAATTVAAITGPYVRTAGRTGRS